MDYLVTYDALEKDKFRNLKHTIKKENGTPLKIKIKNQVIGDSSFHYILGPCSVESPTQMTNVASFLSDNKLSWLRGGTYKLRTTPYSFAGLGMDGVKLLSKVSKEHNLISVTEVTGVTHLKEISNEIDVLMVGQRNMTNIELLQALGKVKNPIILKRSPGATIYEFLAAAEFIIDAGNENVILCERGVRGIDPYNRYMLDLGGAIALKHISRLPVIIDPSHAMGRSELIIPLARAIKASGVDGIICEIHPHPKDAKSDGQQALNLEESKRMVDACEKIKIR